MESQLHLYETEINSLVKEYLDFSGFNKSSHSLVLECKERDKIISNDSLSEEDALKLTAQNNILLEFDSGNSLTFWSYWDEHIPEDIRHQDQTCQRLEFYIQIHFAVYPLRIGRNSLTGKSLEESMTQFKDYLENKGSNLSQTTEFLPFYALPFVPKPTQHPSFKEIFSTYWVPDLRGRVEKFLFAALSVSKPPLLITLVKNKERLAVEEDVNEADVKILQQNLLQAEKRCSMYMKRFNKLQTDYHTLISITAELVDSLEQTVQGRMVTVEYLQQVCARLFNNRSAVVGTSQNFNVTSIDFTRPGTAASMLRASMAVASNNNIQYSDDTPLLPSLDYTKVKSHLKNASNRDKALLLQALRWRLTRSRPGEQRDTVLQDYINNDLLTCRKDFPQAANAGFQMLSLLESDDLVVRQYAVRLYNTLSSLQQGRAYLSSEPGSVALLLKYMWSNREDLIDHVFEEHLLGCLQKLSLRRPLQTVMIKGDLIKWLVSTLSDFETVSDYMLEYAVALLMNLCLRFAGKRKCGEISDDVIKVLSQLLTHENREIRPYVNGAFYSVLSNPILRTSARQVGLETTLRSFMDDSDTEFNRQLEFIIQQLNKIDEGAFESQPDSDDEGDEDDDEDQDAMECDLDKNEIIISGPNELSGEELLSFNFLGIMSSSGYLVKNQMEEEMKILQRPTTPQRQTNFLKQADVRSSAREVSSSRGTPSRSSSKMRNQVERQSTNSLQSLYRPVTSSSRPGSRKTYSKEDYQSTTPRSGRSRQLPIDYEASVLVNELTGLNRNLAPIKAQQSPLVSNKQKEFASAFGSRPRIPRTPDVGGLSIGGSKHSSTIPLSSRGPPNPKFSLSEPQPRPSSGNSHSSSSKASSGSPGESLRNRRTYN